jgi:hypothetical protein
MNKNYNRVIQTDIMVAGAGTAGLCAAIEAGRRGHDVYLIEATDRLGGIMSVCQGMPIGCGYPCQKSIGGIHKEFINRLMKMDPPAAWIRLLPKSVFGWDVYYNQDLAMYTFYEMLEEACVHLILKAITGDVEIVDNVIKSVEYHDMTGTNLIKAKIYIDCTGNGDVSCRAGVPYDLGDEKGQLMACTLSFIMSNVNYDAAFPTEDKEVHIVDGSILVDLGIISEDCRNILYSRTANPGQVYFNWSRIRGVNGLDPDNVLAATNQARKSIVEVSKFLRKTAAGFENAYLDGIGPLIGIRDTRRFEGMYRLTKQDLLDGKKFDDSGIVCSSNAIDDVARGMNGKFINDPIGEKNVKYYRIPFGTLVPQKVKNLMFAGRLLSSDSRAVASARGMGSCMGMGQATGVASSIAIMKNIVVQDIAPREVVDELKKVGVVGLGNEKLI